MGIIEITPKISKTIRAEVRGQRQYIAIGRSHNSAGAGSGTPIVLIEGNSSPVLMGEPYLKTQFCGHGGFRKTLYTASTLRIEVGTEWVSINS